MNELMGIHNKFILIKPYRYFDDAIKLHFRKVKFDDRIQFHLYPETMQVI